MEGAPSICYVIEADIAALVTDAQVPVHIQQSSLTKTPALNSFQLMFICLALLPAKLYAKKHHHFYS